MRRFGTDGWAGLVMLAVAVAVAAPVLFGFAQPNIPQLLWVALFAVFLTSLLMSTIFDAPTARRHAAFFFSVATVWALVLSAPAMGLLLILLVVTAATSVYVVRLWVGLTVVALNTVVAAVATGLGGPEPTEHVLVTGFYLLIQLASLLSSATLLNEQRMRRELAASHVELRTAGILLSESARTAERLRISRELHDLIGHQLTVLTLELETARHLPADPARTHLDRADQVARALLRDVRSTVGELRTQAPDLERALRAMTDALPGLSVAVEVSPRVSADERQSAALVRAAQEVVTNTLRHAEARELRIAVTQDEGGIVLTARDDGRGAPELQFGNGLLGLQERLSELGGEVRCDGRDGFQVTARVPHS